MEILYNYANLLIGVIPSEKGIKTCGYCGANFDIQFYYDDKIHKPVVIADEVIDDAQILCPHCQKIIRVNYSILFNYDLVFQWDE